MKNTSGISNMLNELIRYTEVADETFIRLFLNTQRELPEAETLFSHILNAQHNWVSRIYDRPLVYERFQIHTKDKFMPLHSENITNLYNLLNTNPDVIVKYASPEGRYYESKLSDILFQVINHSTYHRGQVARILKQNGVEPPATDFILLKRQNLL